MKGCFTTIIFSDAITFSIDVKRTAYPTLQARYNAFKIEFKVKILDKYNIFQFGDVTISGSVLPEELPPDLDLVIYMSPENIKALKDYYIKLARSIMTNSNFKKV